MVKWSLLRNSIIRIFNLDITSHTGEGRGRYKKKQAGAKLGQAQVKLEVIVKVGVEDRCIYLILREF